jgi:hypothetical protein
MKNYISIILFSLPTLFWAGTPAVSTVVISKKEVMAGETVTFTFTKDANCGVPGSKVYPEGTFDDEGTVQATYQNNPASGNLTDNISTWTHTYTTPGEYFVWFKCGEIVSGIIQPSKKGEAKSVPNPATPAINGLQGTNPNFNVIRVTTASTIPTLSQWGLIILALLLLTLAVVALIPNSKTKKIEL